MSINPSVKKIQFLKALRNKPLMMRILPCKLPNGVLVRFFGNFRLDFDNNKNLKCEKKVIIEIAREIPNNTSLEPLEANAIASKKTRGKERLRCPFEGNSWNCKRATGNLTWDVICRQCVKCEIRLKIVPIK
ncbi:hypothetical protein BpHYR1_014396 [Brachionus plicatilis]|uniref:Uncharacterized protein n=1 Tax=Brachionus plicatilis TaxID=10195 RepID=A0A3M7R1U9_BRAPC|nr:hypothetical protein BpHYR1_014396 [Brachionus plicatilis]